MIPEGGGSPLREGAVLIVNERVRIPLAEIRFEFSLASGPGGQKVNKTSSRAALRWNALASPSLPEDARERFRARNARRISRAGEVVIASSRFRSRERNAADCLEKLRALLAEAAEAPKPRRPTRPTRASREKRLREKRERGERKRRRRGEGDAEG